LKNGLQRLKNGLLLGSNDTRYPTTYPNYISNLLEEPEEKRRDKRSQKRKDEKIGAQPHVKTAEV